MSAAIHPFEQLARDLQEQNNELARRRTWLGFDAYDSEDHGYATPCWIYRKKPTGHGYAQMKLADGRQVQAHRAFYEHHVGPIPVELTIDHLCEVRRCVNPDHMEPVTRGENNLRGNSPYALNARKTHCVRGHAFDDDNTYIDPTGRRICRTCKREECRRRRAAR